MLCLDQTQISTQIFLQRLSKWTRTSLIKFNQNKNKRGDVRSVLPQGLVHFQRNVENDYAIVIATLSSQNLRVITIANAVFHSNPDIVGDLLTKG
ncbi:RmlC-like cupin domain-containing protein [Cynara cardunculus var. scolymus]|uniref:RmlC-like cupin domain-containing protein n=1 Tax=Cynara cardunculus var. scolymus TaxID=59895 RepID=A0A103DNK3_CYNCS|nr:RmlC-like cupin domain-containing protein [Cynara cardunculus var. scolymus]